MTTIKVSVKNKRDANLLVRLLKRVSFVEKIEEVEKPQPLIDQIAEVTSFLAKNSNISLFSDIADPIIWQKKLRNEWK